MRFLILTLITILSNVHEQAHDVQARHSRYMDRAEVHHIANSATVTANSPRPLAQAVTALSEEYGWVIDFEDPPYYSKSDLVDDTASQWRAAHPSAKGVTAIAGDTFQTQYAENPGAATSELEEERILDRVVSDYNASSNPGRFSLRNEGNGRFAIVGTYVKDENGLDQGVSSILDAPISVQTDTRDALTTIRVILDGLNTKSRIQQVVPGTMALNALHQSQVNVGGENIPARILLLQALSAAKIKLYWHLYYDHDVNQYALNVLPLMKANYDASGNRTTEVVR